MPRPGEIDYVLNQLAMSVTGAMNAEDGLKTLLGVCQDPAEQERLIGEIDELDAIQRRLMTYLQDSLGHYRAAVDTWARQTLDGEPSAGELRVLAGGRNGKSPNGGNRRARVAG